MITEEKYDYIIYSVNLASVLAADFLSANGKKVCMLNHYGFMGGSITESLNCFQLVDEPSLNKKTKEIFSIIKNEKHGILFRSNDELLFNPEVIKIALQKLIEDTKIDLLFHIVPFNLKDNGEQVELSVAGKEGILKLNGRTIIDASEEYNLIRIKNDNYELKDIYCNMFLSGMKDDNWQSYHYLENRINVDDGRYWISLKLPKAVNIFFIENHSQEIINEFEEIVHKSRGRIQLLAPQTHKIYSIEKLRISEKVFHIDTLLPGEFNFKHILSNASELELEMSKLK